MCPYCSGDWGAWGNYPISVDVSGNTATVFYSFNLDQGNTITATYTITASLDPEYDLGRLEITFRDTVLYCHMASTQAIVTAYDKGGRRYNPCHVSLTDAVATISGGPYINFSIPVPAQTMDFQLFRGVGYLYVYVDTTLGFVPIEGE